MESNRKRNRVNHAARHRQRGITVIGFSFSPCCSASWASRRSKCTPMYIKNMRLSRVLEDTAAELGGKSREPDQHPQRDR